MKRTYRPDWKGGTAPGGPAAAPAAKRGRRKIDAKATTRATLTHRACPCGAPSATGHHVIDRQRGGDDVPENIVPMCGSGTTGCHGAVENEDENARRMLGEHLRRERPDVIEYVRAKLGREAGDDWLRRRLYVST